MITTLLFRPVGPKELKLIEDSGWIAFPPRLPEQPIFYPVTNEDYAIQIARDWNVKESGSGFVTQFRVDSSYLEKFPVQIVGGREHSELWGTCGGVGRVQPAYRGPYRSHPQFLMSTSSRLERAQGSLIGLAVGDALGTTVEFEDPSTFPPVTDIVGGGPFHLKAGQWTDDTSMALCLAESLLEKEGFDLRDQAERYVRWWQEGYLSSNGVCFDIGGTVSNALRNFTTTGIAESGSDAPYSAGNGSIMRLAPVPIYFHDSTDAIRYSEASSRTTHQAPECLDACRYLGGVLAGLLAGATKEEVLAASYHPVNGTWRSGELCFEIAAVASGSFKTKMPPHIAGTGYVAQSLEAALWAFHRTSSFEEGALLAVNLGDDADTSGAVYGQIAGAFYGISAIPEGWLEKLAKRDLILDFATRLNNASIS